MLTVKKAKPVTTGPDRSGSIFGYRNGTRFLIRNGNNLMNYRISTDSVNDAPPLLAWQTNNIFGDVQSDAFTTGIDKYPFLIADIMGTGNKNVLIWRASDGVRAASILDTPSGSNIFQTIYRRDNRFGDIYGFHRSTNIFLWDFFFGNSSSFGLFTRTADGTSKFYILSKTALSKNMPTMFKEVKDVNSKLSTEWNDLENDILLENLNKGNGPKEHFLIWGKGGLKIYKFEGKELRLVLQSRVLAKVNQNDKLFPGEFGGSGALKDIVLSSEGTLKVYRYNESSKNYSPLSPTTSNSIFWQASYANSAIMEDVNSDGYSELVYNGPDGISALSFNDTSNTWTKIMSSNIFGWPQEILGSSLLFTDYSGDVKIGEISESLTCPFNHGTANLTNSSSCGNLTTSSQSCISFNPFGETIELEMEPFSLKKDSLAPIYLDWKTSGVQRRPFLPWQDRWDIAQVLKETVDVQNAKVHLKIPLAELRISSEIGFMVGMEYKSKEEVNGAKHVESLLGTEGWNLLFPVDVIIAVPATNGLPAITFNLVTNGNPIELIPKANSGNSSGLNQFTAKIGDVNWEFSYESSNQEWIASSKNERRVYGGSEATKWGFGWPFWGGTTGTDLDSLEEQPLVWYLTERRDNRIFRKLSYTYEVETKKLPHQNGNKSYTNSIKLKSVEDDKCSKITFNYMQKHTTEYEKILPVKNGKISFPIEEENNYFLSGLTVTTSSYQQNFQFIYELDNKFRRVFKGFKEESSKSTLETVFAFSYDEHDQLQSISGGDESPFLVSFTYGTVYIPASSSVALSAAKIINRLEISTSLIKTAKWNEYYIVAYKSQDGDSVRIRILDEKLEQILPLNRIYLETVSSRIGIVDGFEIKVINRCIIILEQFIGGAKEITVFCQNNPKTEWSRRWSSGRLEKDSLILFGVDTFGILKHLSNYVTILHCVTSTPKSSSEPVIVSRVDAGTQLKNFALLSYKDVVVFNGSFLQYYRKGSSGNFSRTNIFRDNGQESNWIDAMRLGEENREKILENINFFRLQSAQNIVLFLSFDFNGSTLTTKANLFHFKGKNSEFQRHQFVLNSLQMSQITEEVDTDHGTAKLGYERRNGLFEVTVLDLFGPKFEKHKRQKARLIRLYQKDLDERVPPPILINMESITRYILAGGDVPTLNKVNGTEQIPFFAMNGHSWKAVNPSVNSTSEKEFNIGDDLQIKSGTGTGNSTTYKITKLETNTQLGSFEVDFTREGDLVFGYPKYIAYQSTNHTQIKVLSLMGSLQEQTLSNERILKFSDSNWFITSTNNEIKFRRASDFIPFPSKQVRVIVKNEMNCNGHQLRRNFVTSYNRINKLMEKKVTLWFGWDRRTSGWMEKSMLMDTDGVGRNFTVTDKWFDGETNELVASKSIELSSQENKSAMSSSINNDNSKNNNRTKIKDISGNNIVADIFPYSVEDEMFGYIGFERNENIFNWLDSNYSDFYNIKNDFPLTGRNCLYLWFGGNEHLTGKFNPKNQNGTYFVSSWVQFSNNEFAQKEKSLMVKVYAQPGDFHFATLNPEVKRENIDGWVNVEAVVNFQILKQLYKDYYDQNSKDSLPTVSTDNSPLPVPPSANFSLEIVVKPVTGVDYIAVDHIRFFPAWSDFLVNVFKYNSPSFSPTILNEDIMSSPVKSIILGNGDIINKIYDLADIREIASFSETGKIEKLTSWGKWEGGRSTLVISPEYGYYETFSSKSFPSNWNINNSSRNSFKVKKGELWHEGKDDQSNDKITFKSTELNRLLIRLYYHMENNWHSGEISLNWESETSLPMTISIKHLENYEWEASIKANGTSTTFSVAPEGEVIAYLDENQGWLFINGKLLNEFHFAGSFTSFFIEFTGTAEKQIRDVMLLTKPELTMQYFNLWGQPIQTIKLESSNSAYVSTMLYDEVGREAIRTKTSRVTGDIASCLLCFHSNYVTNGFDTSSANSVFKTGRLEGLVNRLNPEDEGYPYSRKVYQPTPLEAKICEGRPGKQFACGVANSFVTKSARTSEVDRVLNLFPPEDGFQEEVKIEPIGSIFITIWNQKGQEVAHYVHVPGYDHLLSTNEFDEDSGKISKILPPIYHSEAKTMSRTSPWKFGEFGEDFTETELSLQRKLATKFTYDEWGNLIKKEMPDMRTTHYLYDLLNNKRFSYFMSQADQTMAEEIVYYLYNENSNLKESGTLLDSVSESDLKGYLYIQDFPGKQPFQEMDYNKMHSDPRLRGQLKTILTFNGNNLTRRYSNITNPEVSMEAIRFDSNDAVTEKTFLNTGYSKGPQTLDKTYKGGRISRLSYPSISSNGERLHLLYSYNQLGNLIRIGTPKEPFYFVKYTWLPGGLIKEEELLPTLNCTSFKRMFHYDSPGHLVGISDPFLTQTLDYTGSGYGQQGFGDGIITKATFNATWSSSPAYADWFNVNLDDIRMPFLDKTLCFAALKRLGFLSNDTMHTVPLKLLRKSDFSSLPGRCGGETGIHLMDVIKSKLPPSQNYGFLFAYGNHKELTQAKYFDSTDNHLTMQPLTSKSFSEEIDEVTETKAKDIWRIFNSARIFTVNQSGNDDATTGKGFLDNIFNMNEVTELLEKAEKNLGVVVEPLLDLIYSRLQKSKPTLKDFEKIITTWKGGEDIRLPIALQNSIRKSAQAAYQALNSKGYPDQGDSAFRKLLQPEFLEAVKNLRISNRTTKKLVDLLISKFKNQLGEGPFDVESFQIDPNGNHKEFTVGWKRFKFCYETGTNKISEIHEANYGNPDEPVKIYKVDHDDHGNMLNVPHHKIENILYHPVSNRPIKISLTDGRTIIFEYDAAGERSRKYVQHSDSRMISERHYFRDEKGRVLLDQYQEYNESGTEIVKETKTIYVYGVLGYILGFVRNGKFFSVHLDAAGSTRLVTREGSVVAAYDYMPYGETMRKFGVDPEGQIIFRFTGQEYDEETGLYNFHTRLYDPTLGRFLQIDPMGQSFSPYAYAGNSPISFIDPDGQFFLAIGIGIGMLVGGYLAGAAYHNTWDITKWNFNKDPILKIAAGALAGGLLVANFATSIVAIGLEGTIGLGLSGAGYRMFKVLLKNGGINFLDPKTLYEGFKGFGSALSLVGGGEDEFEDLLTQSDSPFLIITSYLTGAGAAYKNVADAHKGNYKFWEWDKWLQPGTIMGIIKGFDTGAGWPMKIKDISTQSINKLKGFLNTKYPEFGKVPEKDTEIVFESLFKQIQSTPGIEGEVINNVLNKLVSTFDSLSSEALASSGEFNFLKSFLNKFSTYEDSLNSVFSAPKKIKVRGRIRKSKLKPKGNEFLSFASFLNNMVGPDLDKLFDRDPAEQIENTLHSIHAVAEELFSGKANFTALKEIITNQANKNRARSNSRYRRKREIPPTSLTKKERKQNGVPSSASSMHRTFWPLNKIKSWIIDSARYIQSIVKTPPKTIQNDKITLFNEKTKYSSKDNQIRCQRGAWNGDSYNLDALTCKTESDSPTISIFYKPEVAISSDLSTQDFDTKIISKDHYSRLSCVPIEFNKIPSVTCPGKKTDFVFTPNLGYFSKPFDNIDGQIMLAAIVANKSKDFLNFLLGKQVSNEDTEQSFDINGTTCKELVSLLNTRCKELQKLLSDLERNFIDDSYIFSWARHSLEDIQEDLKMPKKRWKNSEFEIIDERLTAIYEDVLDDIELFQENATKSNDLFQIKERFEFTRNNFAALEEYNSVLVSLYTKCNGTQVVV